MSFSVGLSRLQPEPNPSWYDLMVYEHHRQSPEWLADPAQRWRVTWTRGTYARPTGKRLVSASEKHHRKLNAVPHAKFSSNGAHVGAHGMQGDTKPGGNLVVCCPLNDKAGDLPFSGCEDGLRQRHLRSKR